MDLWIAAVVIVMVTAVCAVAVWRLGRRCSDRAAKAAMLTLAAGLVAFLLWGRDALWLAKLLPVKAVIVYVNPVLPIAGAIAALFYAKMTGIPRWRRTLPATIAVLAATYTALSPLTQRPPNCRDRWSGDVCIQTSPVTCTPAAAATLLRFHDIDTTEAAMARLCLTGPEGTPVLGLYRGLRIMAAPDGARVYVGTGGLDALRDPAHLPAIINVRLTPAVDRRNPMYRTQWGWQRGVTHTVVVYGFTPDDRIDIADPDVGREYWDLYSLDDLWQGDYMSIAAPARR